jgi:hypothetical protein
MQSGRSERQHRPASQLPHECRSAGRTMDATDTAAPEIRYCGRSQALLYNEVRPHSSLGYLTPNEFVARGARPAPQQATGRDAAVLGASAPRPVAQPSPRPHGRSRCARSIDCSSGSPFVIERRLNLDRLVDVNLNYWHEATHRLFLRIFLSFGPR